MQVRSFYLHLRAGGAFSFPAQSLRTTRSRNLPVQTLPVVPWDHLCTLEAALVRVGRSPWPQGQRDRAVPTTFPAQPLPGLALQRNMNGLGWKRPKRFTNLTPLPSQQCKEKKKKEVSAPPSLSTEFWTLKALIGFSANWGHSTDNDLVNSQTQQRGCHHHEEDEQFRTILPWDTKAWFPVRRNWTEVRQKHLPPLFRSILLYCLNCLHQQPHPNTSFAGTSCSSTAAGSKLWNSENQRGTLVGIVSHCALGQHVVEPTRIMENNPGPGLHRGFPLISRLTCSHSHSVCSSRDVLARLGVMQGHPSNPGCLEPHIVIPAEMETPQLGLFWAWQDPCCICKLSSPGVVQILGVAVPEKSRSHWRWSTPSQTTSPVLT